MKTKTNNQKTKPSAEALAKLVRKKFIYDIQDMAKLCRENGLSFEISGWVENPADRGDTPEKTLSFRCGAAYASKMLEHKIMDIASMLHGCIKKCSHDEVTSLCALVENLIEYSCKKVMNNLNKEMENDDNSKTKEK